MLVFVMRGVWCQWSHLPPSNKGQKLPGEFCPRVQHSTGDSAPFPSWGLQLSPVVILKLKSVDWMRKPATIASAQSIHLYSHETSLHCLVVKLPGYHLHVFSSAALCVWGILPVGIQRAMSLSTSVPHLTVPCLLQWFSTDTFDYLADKCFIPPPHVIVQILSFIFRLQGGFLGRQSCLAR